MPPFQMNPVNDFYFRNAQSQFNPQQFQQPQYQFPPHTHQGVHCSFVSNIEEARAARSDDFLSTNIFLDTDTGKIYLKKIDNNGKPMFLTYIVEESLSEQKMDPLNEINARLMNIENFLGGLKHDKSVSDNASVQQSESVSYEPVAVTNEPNGTTESCGLQKNAGNGWRKK